MFARQIPLWCISVGGFGNFMFFKAIEAFGFVFLVLVGIFFFCLFFKHSHKLQNRLFKPFLIFCCSDPSERLYKSYLQSLEFPINNYEERKKEQ